MAALQLPITYLAQIASFLAQQGKDCEDWLAEHGIPRGELGNRVRMLDYACYESLIIDAVKLDGRADVGLRIGSYLGVNQHGALGFAIMSSRSIEESLGLLGRYIKTRTPLLDVNVEKDNQHYALVFKEVHDFTPIRMWFFEALVVSLSNIFRFISHSNDVIESIAFPFKAPEHIESYQTFIPHEVQFEQPELKILLKMDAQELQFGGDAIALEQAKSICESEIQQWVNDRSLAEQVANLLFKDCTLSLSQVSEKMHMTPRTLHRRLLKEQIQFHCIQDSVRHALAKQQLGIELQSVKAIAFSLGYADVANFRRAFKRWEGVSPIEYRHKLTQ